VRRAVLDAAAELSTERGVGAVSLRDIAAKADVQLALISRYVGTREQLIDAVLEDLTDQVAQETVERPREQQGFTAASPVVRWTRMLAYATITDRDLSKITSQFNPVLALAKVAQDSYGIDEEAARIRGAQIVASVLGWRLFERYLLAAGGLEDVDPDVLHDELTALHRRMGATPWPSPPDPPTLDQQQSSPPPPTRRRSKGGPGKGARP
jgi:AcrR family transcriptional regulator